MSKIKVDGTEYEWDQHHLMASEARAVKSVTGFSVPEWNDAIGKWDVEALTAMVWLARKRAGETELRYKDVDFDYATFEIIPDVAEAAEEAGEQAPDPSPAA